MIRPFLFVVALGLTASVWGFESTEKSVVRDLSAKLEQSLKCAKALDGKALTLLPVRGDSDGYFGDLLLNAAVNAGKTCVIANDPADSRFARILKEIKWDERQTTLQSVDPATVDRLGRLKSTQVFLEATLFVEKGAKRPTAEVFLRAYAIQTKQYVWTAHEVVPEGTPLPWWRHLSDRVKADPSLLRVKVATDVKREDSAAYASLLDAAVTEAVIESGCTTESAAEPDIVVTLVPVRQVFDRTGEYAVFEGTVQVLVRASGNDRRIVGDRIFSARGKRGLGDLAAEKNLVAATLPQVKAWLKPLLTPSSVGFAATEFELSLGAPVAEIGGFKAPEAVRRAAAGLPGVRSVTLVRQEDGKGTFTYRAVYESSQFPGGFLNGLFVKHPELEKAFVE